MKISWARGGPALILDSAPSVDGGRPHLDAIRIQTAPHARESLTF
jgi:hypothetical protein